MLNTPSVMYITLLYSPDSTASFAFFLKSSISEWFTRIIFALDKRQPSMIEAWFNSSDRIASFLFITAEIAAILQLKPDWYAIAASVPLNSASVSSSSSWMSSVPLIERTAPAPTPRLSIASLAAAFKSSSVAKPK